MLQSIIFYFYSVFIIMECELFVGNKILIDWLIRTYQLHYIYMMTNTNAHNAYSF